MIVLTSHDHVGWSADDLATWSPRHTLALVVVLSEVLLHVVPGDVDDCLHIPDAGLRVYEVGDHGTHRVFDPVAIAPEVHGQGVRSPASEYSWFTFDHVRVHWLFKKYRKLDGSVQTGRRHWVHESVAARQVRPLVDFSTTAARFRWWPETGWNMDSV